MPRLFGRMGRRERTYATVVLATQPLVLLFGAFAAYGLARHADKGPLLWTGCGLALACLLAVGLLGRPFGVTVGWLLQLATFTWALVVPAMLLVAVMFLALWVTALHYGRRLDVRDAGIVAADKVGA